MAAITSNTESWNSHSFSEVETHIKDRLSNRNPDKFNGHEYVEVAHVKWATMNIGATGVTDTGLYFQWGDTTGYLSSQCGSSGTTYAKPFNWADYKFGNGKTSPGATGMTKYNASDGKTVLDIGDDAARVNWGGGWRMPTENEFMMLEFETNTAWTESYQGSGVAGLVCTDKTDSSKVLFFPAAGQCVNGRANSAGVLGSYWLMSCNRNPNYYQYAIGMQFFKLGENSGPTDMHWEWREMFRSYGFPVRGVVD